MNTPIRITEVSNGFIVDRAPDMFSRNDRLEESATLVFNTIEQLRNHITDHFCPREK